MSPIENPLRLAREMKGAPMSILFIMGCLHQPVGESALVAYSGYNERVIRRALGYLNEVGLVRRISRYNGWVLSEGAMQLPLSLTILEAGAVENTAPDEETDPAEERAVLNTAPEVVEVEARAVLNTAQNENPMNFAENPGQTGSGAVFNTAPACLASSSSLTINSRPKDENLLLARQNPQDEIAALLDEAGIADPAREQILAMQGLTPELVRGHIQTTDNPGQAIYRIKRRWKVRPRAPVDESCPECGRVGGKHTEGCRWPYTHGKFAELFEH